MIRITVLIIIAFSISGCVSNQADPVIDETRKVLKVGDTDLFYGITIPDSYQYEKPVPLILALHYGGNFSDYYGRSFAKQLIEPGLGQLGAIVISPTCPYLNWTTDISEKAVIGLINFILSEYSIDKEKIIVTGFSLGGAGTWHFASKYPELFSIAIPIAGPVWSFDLEFLKNILAPVYVIHSRDDEAVPFQVVEETVNLLSYYGIYIEFRILEGMYHYEVSNYTPFLREAIPWIYSVWDQN